MPILDGRWVHPEKVAAYLEKRDGVAVTAEEPAAPVTPVKAPRASRAPRTPVLIPPIPQVEEQVNADGEVIDPATGEPIVPSIEPSNPPTLTAAEQAMAMLGNAGEPTE